MPPRPTGRHRRPKPQHVGTPTVVGAVALAAAAVGGLNIPAASGTSQTAEPTAGGAQLDAGTAGTSGASRSAREATDAGSPGASAATVAHRAVVTAPSAAQRRERVRQAKARSALASRAEQRIALEIVKQRKEAAARRAAWRSAHPTWVAPVDSFRWSAGFGESSGLWSHLHTGQDFAAPVGTPVHAVGAGQVVKAGYDGSYGNKLEIRHPDGTVTYYCHMNDFVVRSGSVAAGQVVGHIGLTGNTTGPHLHLEVRPGGADPIDPVPWLRAHGVKL